MLACLTFALLAIASVCRLPGAESHKLDFDPGPAFDEVGTNVDQHFWDPEFNGVDWKQMQRQYRPRALAATSRDEFADVMNEMLSHLRTSHTHYFATTDPRRSQLLGIFDVVAPDTKSELFTYEGIGIATVNRGDRTFVTGVFDGLPAAKAGLLYGDEIVAVDSLPFHPTQSFRGKAGQQVRVSIRRDGPEKPPQELMVDVQRLNGRTMFETAMQASARVIRRGDKSVGYVHVWSYAGRKYQDLLQDLILWKDLSQCDSLVLDLRDGWGGASLEYINIFRKPVVKVTSQMRGSDPMNFSGVWGKPVVLLTNGGSTSGKELFTFAFRKLELGEIVGTRTAGAVVAGRCMLMQNGDVLYLAVANVHVDGKRLEGVGVQPTVVVPRPLEYAAGNDPQLDKAVEILVDPEVDAGERPRP